MPLWCIAIFFFTENSFNNMEGIEQIILLKKENFIWQNGELEIF